MSFTHQTKLCLLMLLFVAVASARQTRVVKARNALTVTPQNVAVHVGDTVILQCEAQDAPPSSRILWSEFVTFEFGSTISDNDQILSHPNRDRYMIINDTPTMFHLLISDIRMSDGGRYACADSMSASPDVFRGDAQLIVFETEPNCTSTLPMDGVILEGQNHTIECTINYQGAFSPAMQWAGPPPFLQANSTTATTVWSGISFRADRSMYQLTYNLTTLFTQIPQVPPEHATNVPSYTHLYLSPALFVFWGPKNTYAVPVKSEYAVDDVITCYTDAQPSAYFMWQNMRTLEQFFVQTFVVTPDMLGTNQSMRCQAQNFIGGFTYSDNIFIPVYVPQPGSTTETTPPTTTTPPPAESDCYDLTGGWESNSPTSGTLCIRLDVESNGELRGLMRNDTDTYFVDIVGRAQATKFDQVGFNGIWPAEIGVSSFIGECHRCYGLEQMLVHVVTRSKGSPCGTPGPLRITNQYTFFRSDNAICPNLPEISPNKS